MRKQQHYVYSCGATSLLCGAGELGITALPYLNGSMCVGQQLQTDNACESALYQITSGASTGARPVGHDLSRANYSFPHNMVLAARVLGLNCEVYIQAGMLSGLLLHFYPECESLCAQSGVTIRRNAPTVLAHNQRKLIILGIMGGVVGLHYVLQRPDGSYMDPADGNDYATFKQMNGFSRGYVETGITIVLTA